MASEMHLQLIAAALRRGRSLDRLSSGLSLLALVIGLGPLLGFMALSTGAAVSLALLVCGVLQKYFALRVALDADLFTQLAGDMQQLDRRTRELDQVLASLGKPVLERSWEQRSRGALRLLRLQTLCFALQLLVATAAIALMPWLSQIRFG